MIRSDHLTLWLCLFVSLPSLVLVQLDEVRPWPASISPRPRPWGTPPTTRRMRRSRTPRFPPTGAARTTAPLSQRLRYNLCQQTETGRNLTHSRCGDGRCVSTRGGFTCKCKKRKGQDPENRCLPCNPLMFGENCKRRCVGCDPRLCHRVTGCAKCLNGWDPAPTCDKIDCKINPCLNGAFCVGPPKAVNGSIMRRGHCSCPAGFTGLNCESNIIQYFNSSTGFHEDNLRLEPCNSLHNKLLRSCDNHGKCYMLFYLAHDKFDSFCICYRQYWGLSCFYKGCKQKESTCLHGFCRKNVCYCDKGWQGESCNKPCIYNWYGTNCSHLCGYCRSPPCDRISGLCPGNRCLAGYTGSRCQEDDPLYVGPRPKHVHVQLKSAGSFKDDFYNLRSDEARSYWGGLQDYFNMSLKDVQDELFSGGEDIHWKFLTYHFSNGSIKTDFEVAIYQLDSPPEVELDTELVESLQHNAAAFQDKHGIQIYPESLTVRLGRGFQTLQSHDEAKLSKHLILWVMASIFLVLFIVFLTVSLAYFYQNKHRVRLQRYQQTQGCSN